MKIAIAGRVLCDGKDGEELCKEELKGTLLVETSSAGLFDIFASRGNTTITKFSPEGDPWDDWSQVVESVGDFPKIFCPAHKEQANTLRKKIEEDKKAIKPATRQQTSGSEAGGG